MSKSPGMCATITLAVWSEYFERMYNINVKILQYSQ